MERGASWFLKITGEVGGRGGPEAAVPWSSCDLPSTSMNMEQAPCLNAKLTLGPLQHHAPQGRAPGSLL